MCISWSAKTKSRIQTEMNFLKIWNFGIWWLKKMKSRICSQASPSLHLRSGLTNCLTSGIVGDGSLRAVPPIFQYTLRWASKGAVLVLPKGKWAKVSLRKSFRNSLLIVLVSQTLLIWSFIGQNMEPISVSSSPTSPFFICLRPNQERTKKKRTKPIKSNMIQPKPKYMF